jgi:hypothetical protein
MKSYGPLYIDKIQYYHNRLLPIAEKGWTQETDYPYRKSKLCVVFRVPFTKPGFVLGLWEKVNGYIFEEDADDMLSKALNLREMDLETKDIREW